MRSIEKFVEISRSLVQLSFFMKIIITYYLHDGIDEFHR